MWPGRDIWKKEGKKGKVINDDIYLQLFLLFILWIYLPLSGQLAAIRQGKDILQAGHPSHLQPKNYILTSSVYDIL